MLASRTWQIRGRTLALDHPLVMGVVNVTPDSFSDGGRFFSVADAVSHGSALLGEGADILDIGGESTRPQGAQPVSADEELARVLPVVCALVTTHPDAVISIDTVKAVVAHAALDAGAHIVNDVSALRLDPRMGRVIADAGAGVVLMHSRGSVADMGTYLHADYEGDVVQHVEHEMRTQLTVARHAGIALECIAVDPGLGFAKRPHDSLRMLACLERLAQWGCPIAVGASRKRFIGSLTGETNAANRIHGSVGAAVAAYDRGASIFRVHDVAATRQALDVAHAVRRAAFEAAVAS